MRRILAIGAILIASAAAAQVTITPGDPKLLNALKTMPNPADLDAARRITRDEAMKLVKQSKAVYIDVRSKQTYDRGHIPGALSLPGSQLLSRMREIPPGKTVITYCACEKEHTAAQAVINLNAHGVKNAAALVGGWNEWTALGLPTQVSKR